MKQICHGMVTDGHLGGYIPGGDPDTTYPEMWDWLVDTWEVKSVLDVGCGDGAGALTHFKGRGIDAFGIEGIPQDNPLIYQHDYTTGRFEEFQFNVDLVWSAEFVEHVEEKYAHHFLADFARGRFVLMTHGEPGQPGWHHVNNQPADYWKGALAAIGYEYDEVLTFQARRLAGLNDRPYNHFKRCGLAFRRTW